MPDFDVGVAFRAGLDALGPVFDVINRFVALVFRFFRQRRGQLFRVRRDLVAVDFELALFADDDAAETRAAVAVEFKASFDAVREERLHASARADDFRHMVIVGAGFVFGVGAVREFAGVADFARLFQNELRRARKTRADRHLHLVEGVRPPAGDAEAETAGVVVAPVAPAVLNFRNASAEFRLVRPNIPPRLAVFRVELEARVVIRNDVRPDEVRNENRLNFPDRAVCDLVASPAAERKRALLRPDLRYFLELFRGVGHRAAFFNRQRHRLFDVNVRPAKHRVNRDPSALVRRRLAADAVEFFRFDHLAEVVVRFEMRAILHIIVDARLENVANGDEFAVFRLGNDVRDVRPATAEPDDANSNPFARRGLSVETKDASGDEERGGDGGRFQQSSSSQLHINLDSIITGMKLFN